MKELGVTILRADWTNQDPQITAYLHSLGAAGVPLYVYYRSDGEVDVWPQLLTQAVIIDRLEQSSRQESYSRDNTLDESGR
jgi:thiol:disulfide interchange protein